MDNSDATCRGSIGSDSYLGYANIMNSFVALAANQAKDTTEMLRFYQSAIGEPSPK